jgi:hypothetical protein
MVRIWASQALVVRAVITPSRRLRQEDDKFEFEANLGYLVRPCLKKTNKQTKNLGRWVGGGLEKLPVKS